MTKRITEGLLFICRQLGLQKDKCFEGCGGATISITVSQLQGPQLESEFMFMTVLSFCVCSFSIFMGLLWLFHFLPTFQKHASRWTGDFKWSLGENECVWDALWWIGVTPRMYSGLMSSTCHQVQDGHQIHHELDKDKVVTDTEWLKGKFSFNLPSKTFCSSSAVTRNVFHEFQFTLLF